jgi:DNA-3-methyladenine glycosylase I
MHPYCSRVADIVDKDDVDKVYHDRCYGTPIADDNELFGRLLMEINQAGLSWRTILRKKKGFRMAYHQFDIDTVAAYEEDDVGRLMGDSSIIRNKLKIAAAIHNARSIQKLREEFGSWRRWLDIKSEEYGHDTSAWIKEFRRHFTFVGGEIVGEFLMSIGLLPGAHGKECARYRDMLG